MSVKQLQDAGLISADALTKLLAIDSDDPNTATSKGVTQSPIIFDYTQIRDVDFYIELTAYRYQRGLQGGQPGRGKEIVIRLPLLSSITLNYDMNYTNKDMALFYDAIVQGGIDIYKGEDFTDRVGTAAKSLGKAFDAAAQTALNAAGGGGEYNEQLNNILGVAKNPRQEASFVGVGMRNHAFGWVLVPRNELENELIQNIIFALKLRMHPEATGIATAESFLKFPDEFTISFKTTRGNKSLNVPSIPDCFLANLNVVYNQNGQARFFDDNNPTSYRIDMGFVEGNQITRRDIEIGGY